MSTPNDTDFSNGRDSQVGEPYAYIYEFDSKVFGIHRSFSSNQWNGLSPSRCVPVYTALPTAQINQQLVDALQFVIDCQESTNGSDYQSGSALREAANMARAALAATQMRGDA